LPEAILFFYKENCREKFMSTFYERHVEVIFANQEVFYYFFGGFLTERLKFCRLQRLLGI
jgi:hypothetical protein